MSDAEKLNWYAIMVGGLAVNAMFMMLGAFVSGGEAGYDTILMLGIFDTAFIGAYLLILSWRAAYLSGRRHQ